MHWNGSRRGSTPGEPLTKPAAVRLAREQGGVVRAMRGVWRRTSGYWIKTDYVVDVPDGTIQV